MKKKLLLVYGKGNAELLNRQSALGSYIFCLLDLLRNEFDIDVNGIAFDQLAQQNASVQLPPSGGNPLKKIIPRFVREIRRDRFIYAVHAGILSAISKEKKYDLVLEFYTYGSRLGLQLSQQSACPLVTVFDSPVLEEYEFFHGKKSAGKSKIIRNQNDTLKASAQTVVYSNAVKKYVSAITGKSDNIGIHQNVDFTRFNFLEPRPAKYPLQIGFIGSFLKWHRVDLLIQVFEKLRSENIDAHLWLVGNGMEFTVIQKQVEMSVYKNDISLTGFCDGEKLLEIKKKLHIGVMPGSNWYGAPNKIFEYGAAGLAVVAPATPTIADLFAHEKEILLFDWDNLDSAHAVLRQLCQDFDLLTGLQKSLQHKIREKYSEKNTREFYAQLLSKALVFKSA